MLIVHVRDGADRLVRRTCWLDMNDRTLVMVMVNGIVADLPNDQKRAHLTDLRREHLIDQDLDQKSRPEFAATISQMAHSELSPARTATRIFSMSALGQKQTLEG
jgi:hypothetical protein